MHPQRLGHGSDLFAAAHRRRGDDGPHQAVSIVVCRDCGATQEIAGNGPSLLPPEIVAKKLRQIGWDIGRNINRHRCPTCAAGKPKEKKIMETKRPVVTSMGAKLVAAGVGMSAAVRRVETSAPPDGVRTMSRDDWRIVFSKINDHYLDEHTGYSEGWSDKRIAEDLNVPRAWVESIRDEKFGPARDNEEIRQFLDKLETMRSEASAIVGGLVASKEDHKKHGERLFALDQKVGTLQADLARLLTLASQIKKAVGA